MYDGQLFYDKLEQRIFVSESSQCNVIPINTLVPQDQPSAVIDTLPALVNSSFRLLFSIKVILYFFDQRFNSFSYESHMKVCKTNDVDIYIYMLIKIKLKIKLKFKHLNSK